jgi:hypothetical protein
MSKPIVVPQSVRRKAGLTIVPKKPVWDDDATAMAEVMRIIEEEEEESDVAAGAAGFHF